MHRDKVTRGLSSLPAHHLFDQLAVLAPVMLALTAATPIARGALLDSDVRWDIIAQSVDDRTPAERGMDDGAARHPEMAGGGVKRLPKSRYDSISSFICDHLGGKDEQTRTERYNDVDAPIDEEALPSRRCVAVVFSRVPDVDTQTAKSRREAIQWRDRRRGQAAAVRARSRRRGRRWSRR